jgi:localization factor PodJL
MRKAIPWGVRGGGVDVREAARKAARREGMNLSEWLAQVVGQYAAQTGADSADLDEDDCAEAIATQLRRLGIEAGKSQSRRDKTRLSSAGRKSRSSKSSAGIEESLLEKAFARLEDDDFDEPALDPFRADPELTRAPFATPHPQRRASLGNAIAEITMRQRDLEEDTGLFRGQQSRGWDSLNGSFVGATLEHLRSDVAALAGQVQGLRRDQAERQSAPPPACNLDKLRSEIGVMSDALRDLASRGSVAPLEATIRNLSQQIEASRGDGIREAVLQPLERLLADVRVALAEVDPRTTIRGLEGEVKMLGSKLAPVERLERQVEALNERFDLLRDMAARRESSPREDADLQAVADELRALTGESGGATLAKIERQLAAIAGKVDEALVEARDETRYTALANRINDVHRELAERMSQGMPPIDVRALETLVRRLAEKVEEANGPQADSRAIEALQKQVSEFAARLDRTNSGLSSITSLEQSLGDLFAELEKTRDVSYATAEKAARSALDQANAHQGSDIGEMRTMQDEAGQRTMSTLNAVHETLEKVVDRLAMVESELADVRGKRPAEILASGPAPNFAPAPGSARMPPPFATTKAPPFATDETPSPAPQVDMLDDFLIEPGRGFPGSHQVSDDSVEQKPNRKSNGSDATEAGSGRAGFIAAARRAAQAAQMESAAAIGRTPRGGIGDEDSESLIAQTRNFIAHHKRPVVLSIAALFLAMGAYAVVKTVGHTGFLDLSAITGKDAPPARVAPAPAPARMIPGLSGTPLPKPAASNDSGNNGLGQQANIGVDPIVTGAIGPRPPDLSRPSTDAQEPSPALLQTLARSGNAKAQYELATDYAVGRGVTRDFEVAAQWYEKAAAQGLVPAQYRLGSLYEKGLGVQRNSDEAMVWYRKAADRGNVRAMHNLAVLTAEGGESGKPDYAGAAQWFRKAAEYGVRDSQYNVAILLARGLGVQQNLSLSYVWFAIAATQGDDDAGKKRDDVGARLNPADLAAANAMAAAFHPKTPEPEANDVTAPPGGWTFPPSSATKVHAKVSRLF